jgi:5-(carboxyamino)imidazole ribonucleotide synthase
MKSIYDKEFKLGVLGGGQLGRMLIQQAISWDVNVYCLDPSTEAPCKEIANGFTQGDFNDYNAVKAFGKDKDVLTIEIEHVNTKALKELEEEGVKVYPQTRIIELVQDKGAQKSFYKEHGFPSSDFVLVDSKSEVKKHFKEGGIVQKLRRGGYDGRGVQLLRNKDQLLDAFDAPSVIEDLVDIEKELGVIVARNPKGEVNSFPVVDMEFNKEANLVEFLYAPASISKELEQEARQLAESLIDKLEMVGLLAVELFLDKQGNLLINEIAPRPHNSGHHTIEGNYNSQYALLLRSILSMHLGSTETIKPAAMLNLLGEKGYEGPVYYVGLDEALEKEGVFVHIYGKKITKPFRKMGHVTVLGDDLDQLRNKIDEVKKILKVKSK